MAMVDEEMLTGTNYTRLHQDFFPTPGPTQLRSPQRSKSHVPTVFSIEFGAPSDVLFGDDLLVAPVVVEMRDKRPVPRR